MTLLRLNNNVYSNSEGYAYCFGITQVIHTYSLIIALLYIALLHNTINSVYTHSMQDIQGLHKITETHCEYFINFETPIETENSLV